MKLPRQLTKEELIKIVEGVRDHLYMDQNDLEGISLGADEKFARKVQKQACEDDCRNDLYDFLNPEAEWEATDICDGIANLLANYHLVPTKPMTVAEAYKPGPIDKWDDNTIQFPRLLDELQGVGVVDLLKEAEWEALEQSMDLKREDIMDIWSRAGREWDRIKAELCPKRGKQ